MLRPLYADGENRTRKGKPTRPSSVRVYQFHHIRVVLHFRLPREALIGASVFKNKSKGAFSLKF